MFQNVSDEAISAGESASFIISQMIAFGIEAKDAQSIIDKVNETANKFSVSSGDLSKALGIVASTSSAMGNSIDQTLGVVTAITEQTRNASKSARAANTIFSRLAQVVDENSDTGAKLTEIYNNLGIALYDSSGQMRSTYDILADLASKWDSLDKNTQQYIAITSAGTNQLNNFLALMNNFDHAAEATATSLNSAGSAMRENEAFQESLEYQTNNLKATFQDLANNVIDKELISSVLKLSNAFLELADTGLGQFIAKTALLGGTAWGLSSLVKVTKIIPVITSQFKNLASVIGMISNPAVISSIGGIGTALSTVGGFAGVALPMLLGISAALVGIVELVDYIENKDVRKLENLSSAIQDTNDKIAEMSGAGSEYDTLINNADKLTEKEQERLGVLQAQLDNLKEQAAEQEAAYLKEWQSQQTEQKTETTHELVTGSATEVPEGATKLYGQYWDVATTTEYTESQRAAENLRTAINNLNSEKRLGVTVGSEYISKLQGIIDEYQETYDTTIKVRDAGYELDDSQEYLVKVMEYQKEVIAGLGEEYAKNSEDISQFANALDESASNLDTYIDALDQYRGANEDAATAGDILVQSLFDTNGELTEAAKQALTTDSAMASMAQSFIEAQQAQAQADFSALILAIQEVGNAAMITSSQIANMMAMAGVNIGGASSGTASANLQRTYKDITGKTAASDEAAYKSWMQSYLYEKGQASYKRKMEEYQKQLSQVSVYAGGGGGGGGSSRKSAEEKAAEEAEKQAKKAQKAQEKAAKQSQQAYESAAKSAEQAAQEAARAAEQAAEEAKQKLLDSIQELKDASDDFWDSKTDAIEETNKELDRQKQLEEKLKALEEAKQKKILLYKNGQFQWDKDYGTIAKAQADYEETRDKIQRERELEQLKEMKDNATEIFNEMKDIVQNGGDVTQEMINSWLSQMQADGADYYDSNKQMLSEWLDWAKGAISEISQNIQKSMGESGDGYGYGGGSYLGDYSTGSTTTRGQAIVNEIISNWIAANKKTPSDIDVSTEKGQKEYAKLQKTIIQALKDAHVAAYYDHSSLGRSYEYNPLYYDDNNDFVGLSVAFWVNKFQEQIKHGFEPLNWLGGGLGTNLFDDWDNVLKEFASMEDPYALQDALDRVKAAKQVLKWYKQDFVSLGYDKYADIAEQIENMDIDEIYRKARIKAAVSKGKSEDPFGWRVISPVDYSTSEGKLYNFLQDIASFEQLTGSESIASGNAKDKAYPLMTITGNLYKTAQLTNYHTASIEKFTDALGEYYPLVQDVAFNTKDLSDWLKNNEDVLDYLHEAWWEAEDTDTRKAIAEEARIRREAGTLGYEILGEQTGVDTTAEISRIQQGAKASTTGWSLEDERQRVVRKNIDNINATLEKYAEGYGATQHWIDDATKYITDTLNRNNEALLTADEETRKQLLAQNEQLTGIRDSLTEVETSGDVNILPGDTTSYTPWEAEIVNPTDEELMAKQVARLEKQMAANSKAWWDASEEERDALHEANVELAKQINNLTGSNLTYEGHTGTWSKNASGTHNFRGGLSLVGENGPELRVLGQGDNVIPAYQTANLWKWSGTTPESMLKTLELRKGSGCNSYTFNVSKLELPNVSNAKEFVAGLKNYALQYSYRR